MYIFVYRYLNINMLLSCNNNSTAKKQNKFQITMSHINQAYRFNVATQRICKMLRSLVCVVATFISTSEITFLFQISRRHYLSTTVD